MANLTFLLWGTEALVATTSVPLGTGSLEGPACQVRCTTLDYPFRFGGHDRHAPRNGLPGGTACRVRRTTWRSCTVSHQCGQSW